MIITPLFQIIRVFFSGSALSTSRFFDFESYSDHIKSFVTIQICLLCRFDLSYMHESVFSSFIFILLIYHHHHHIHTRIIIIIIKRCSHSFSINLNNQTNFVYLAKIIKLLFSMVKMLFLLFSFPIRDTRHSKYNSNEIWLSYSNGMKLLYEI